MEPPCQSMERLDSVHHISSSRIGNMESGVVGMVQPDSDWSSAVLDLAKPQNVRETKNHQTLEFQSRSGRKSVVEKKSVASTTAPSKSRSGCKYHHSQWHSFFHLGIIFIEILAYSSGRVVGVPRQNVVS